MKIKTLTIRNFKSYAGENTFEFGDHLNLIIGSNGDGKTSLFEAITWLFDIENNNEGRNLLNNFANKTLANMEVNDIEEMSVEMIFDHGGKKILTKKLDVKKTGEKSASCPSKAEYSAKEEKGSQRIAVYPPGDLLERCFPTVIRRYSMFQGEDGLMDILKPSSATMNSLINDQTDKREFDDYRNLLEKLKAKANRAAKQKAEAEGKNKDEIRNLEKQRDAKQNEISQLDILIDAKNDDIATADSEIERLEINAGFYEDKKRLDAEINQILGEQKKLDKELRKSDPDIDLLDKAWILKGFKPILDQFNKKVHSLLVAKKEEESKILKEQGKLEALNNLQSDLSLFDLTEENLKSILEKHQCSLCGSEVAEGSSAYNQIKRRLDQFKATVENKVSEAEQQDAPFKHEYIEELQSLSVQFSGYRQKDLARDIGNIPKERQIRKKQEEDLTRYSEDISRLENEKEKLYARANKDGNTLDVDGENYKHLLRLRGKAEGELERAQNDKTKAEKIKKELEDDITLLVINATSEGDKYQNFVKMLGLLSQAFKEACDENVRSFLNHFEEQTNIFLAELSADDFQGNIKISRDTEKDSYIYTIQDNDGVTVWSTSDRSDTLSQSQKVAACMAMLFATSKISRKKFKNPLIFDAPTSTFDAKKARDFYKTISNSDQQCIIMTKDPILENGHIDNEILNGTNCTIYQISKDPGFQRDLLSTMSTHIEKIQEAQDAN